MDKVSKSRFHRMHVNSLVECNVFEMNHLLLNQGWPWQGMIILYNKGLYGSVCVLICINMVVWQHESLSIVSVQEPTNLYKGMIPMNLWHIRFISQIPIFIVNVLFLPHPLIHHILNHLFPQSLHLFFGQEVMPLLIKCVENAGMVVKNRVSPLLHKSTF